ncbi:MAG TPA: CopD family protein [Phenylobacterium sp.]|uniref:CopD family protein n=1 Tax=Phenylobacterium sp. TaxID=1871053 RepID=UPI002B4A668E|nr:CopD family protein [Phenylobacterium sp.]HKR90442.1 CopD family protein [Phenylobacterium sp.]
MTDWLIAHYDLLRGLHILAVIAWMAGLLYLPRLYAYHTGATPGSELDLTFRTMEAKLLRIIMNPAFVLAFVFGLTLIWVDGHIRGWGFLGQPWMVVKLAGVVFLIGWHHVLARARKAFAEGRNRRSSKFWRATNELPFLAAIVMVIAVTTEFGK